MKLLFYQKVINPKCFYYIFKFFKIFKIHFLKFFILSFYIINK